MVKDTRTVERVKVRQIISDTSLVRSILGETCTDLAIRKISFALFASSASGVEFKQTSTIRSRRFLVCVAVLSLLTYRVPHAEELQ